MKSSCSHCFACFLPMRMLSSVIENPVRIDPLYLISPWFSSNNRAIPHSWLVTFHPFNFKNTQSPVPPEPR
ncbi:hypothetical protein PM082_004955 [Marasmius tenuissimus]|nr:hypothetical protein PM082_004955 [Marasmius tenuissimus]